MRSVKDGVQRSSSCGGGAARKDSRNAEFGTKEYALRALDLQPYAREVIGELTQGTGLHVHLSRGWPEERWVSCKPLHKLFSYLLSSAMWLGA